MARPSDKSGISGAMYRSAAPFSCFVCHAAHFPVYFALPFKPMGERVRQCISHAGTPPKAQHPQPLRLKEPLTQANLESVGIAGHRRGTRRMS